MNDLTCIYHKSCADGLGAAWAVHRAFPDCADFRAAGYGDEPPDVAGRRVLVVDFSYPIDKLVAMIDGGARGVLVIDHHVSAQRDLAGLADGREAVEEWRRSREARRVAVIFDMERSGAGLTWDVLNPEEARPRIVDLVEDRDLWRFRHDPDTRNFHALLTSWDALGSNSDVIAALYMLDGWDLLQQDDPASWRSLLNEGAAARRAIDVLTRDVVRRTARTAVVGGYSVPFANVPGALASEAGNLLCAPDEAFPGEVPFSCTYYDSSTRRHLSLRSSAQGIDVSVVAKRYGGGGHRSAAGFVRPIGWEGDE